ncbi:PEP-CTERM sorting domain-containing protein [Kiritimatiellaeota bacterium B1221]|nr:PEP-CTERM sorting domain-containing protein [Kiritimatiellaeota bacterium B1221]
MKVILLPILFVMTCLLHVKADVLFSDSFEAYADGGLPSPTWDVYNPSNLSLAHVSNAEASVGSQSMYIRNGDSKFSYLEQNTAINISGNPDALVFSFDIKGTYSLASHEGLSSFEVDFGSGFETVLSDLGELQGGDHTYTGTTLTLSSTASSSTAPFIRYAITVPKTYFADVLSASTVRTKLSTKSGWSNLNFYVDNITVTAIPEPSSLLMLLSGFGLLFAGMRTRNPRS